MGGSLENYTKGVLKELNGLYNFQGWEQELVSTWRYQWCGVNILRGSFQSIFKNFMPKGIDSPKFSEITTVASPFKQKPSGLGEKRISSFKKCFINKTCHKIHIIHRDGSQRMTCVYVKMLAREENLPALRCLVSRLPKVFFIWLAARGVILTADNLSQRRIILRWMVFLAQKFARVWNTSQFCHVASRLWSEILGWFGLMRTMLGTRSDVYSVGMAYCFIGSYVCCVDCEERNIIAFEGTGHDFVHFKNSL